MKFFAVAFKICTSSGVIITDGANPEYCANRRMKPSGWQYDAGHCGALVTA